ncbi:MAG: shikimate dehydrogenase [Acidimicrobiia bacterium]
MSPATPISGATRLAAVIGHPVRHSLSPALHNSAFAAGGLDWRFVAFDVAPGGARDAVAAMKALGIGGFAVTMPHKTDVAAAVDEVDAAAAALRSVNTVVLRDDGTTFGASTDGQGFVDSLRSAGVTLDGRRVVVLGAGGAARSIVDALGRAGVADIAVVNRTEASAVAVSELAETGRVGSLDDVAAADVLVNTTSVGMGTDELPIDPSLLHDRLTVADIVYHPLRTALLAAAERVGAATVDGLGMLVHQAVLQQQLWTGATPDPAVMRQAAEAELARRS